MGKTFAWLSLIFCTYYQLGRFFFLVFVLFCQLSRMSWLGRFLPTDKEKPKVSDCPLNIYQTTSTNTLNVSWTEPTFNDNVAVVNVHATQNPGDTFQQGSTNVIYTAKDAANNQETCSFVVNVKSKCVSWWKERKFQLIICLWSKKKILRFSI